MLQESEIFPYHISQPPGERIVVLAPHPDDETLGCGGTIRLLLKSKKSVKVVFLTSGDKADPDHKLSKADHQDSHVTGYALLREKEALKALKDLGVTDYEFMRFPDRAIHENYKEVLEKLLRITDVFMPDVIYSPSMIELNPDHRAAAALSLDIQKRRMDDSLNTGNQVPLKVVFYEITVPLRPNMLIDVTPVYRIKKRAMKRYRSQTKLADYTGYITALSKVRSLTVKGARHVEAFWSVKEILKEEYIEKWLSYHIKM